MHCIRSMYVVVLKSIKRALCSYCRKIEMLKLLLESGADLYAVNSVRLIPPTTKTTLIIIIILVDCPTGWEHSVLAGTE